jgi:hypothetical protein
VASLRPSQQWQSIFIQSHANHSHKSFRQAQKKSTHTQKKYFVSSRVSRGAPSQIKIFLPQLFIANRHGIHWSARSRLSLVLSIYILLSNDRPLLYIIQKKLRDYWIRHGVAFGSIPCCRF